MNRAITFCAIALGIPAVTCEAVSNYLSMHSVLIGIHADNGLVCTLERMEHTSRDALPYNYRNGIADEDVWHNVWHIEFLPNNKFRVVDEKAVNDILADDYIGTMTTTDKAYTLEIP